MALPRSLTLEVVTPEGLLLKEEVDEVVAPGELGSFGVRPGHTPFLAILGVGEIAYRQGPAWHRLACFWGFAEVLSDRVGILAEVAQRIEDLDLESSTAALARRQALHGEPGYEEAHQEYIRLVRRLSSADRAPSS